MKSAHTFAPFDSNLETMRSASGKRHPGEKHNPGEETSRPRQCSEACGKYRKEGAHAPLDMHRSVFKNSAKFRQTFSHFCSSILNLFFAILVQISPVLMSFFPEISSNCTEKIKIYVVHLDSQISCPGISQRIFLKFSENDFRKVRKTLS